ncbi:NADH:ubiquinone oxidoreductase subunit NDUFA12 [Pseudooceanicola sp. MF1-13]|uniref:NADH:ubiquinone oxidoreductase subunit NDUFA12 n=1 Tax=Pseudooceanicola sp. MF1-13 TaxID=3379095 RepID=UPI003891BC78
MGILNSFLSAVTWWNGATLNTRLYTRRKGTKVGEDENGNVFYTANDGKKRWVIYNGEVEASRIGADWHGWLHHTYDETPKERPMAHKPWEKEHLPNMTGTPEAYAPAGSLRRPEPVTRKDYEAWTPE